MSYNIPYKQYAANVLFELLKSDDEEIVEKFIKELRRISKLKQFQNRRKSNGR